VNFHVGEFVSVSTIFQDPERRWKPPLRCQKDVGIMRSVSVREWRRGSQREEFRGSTRGTGVRDGGVGGRQRSDEKQADGQAIPDARYHAELAQCEAQHTKHPAGFDES
jgi:hypothetical protein